MGAGASARGAGQEESDFVTLPLWVEVVKNGLETRIAFHGEWVFTNHLPQEIQVRKEKAWYVFCLRGLCGVTLVLCFRERHSSICVRISVVQPEILTLVS